MIGKMAMAACVCLLVTAREPVRLYAVPATQVMGSSRGSSQEQEMQERRRQAINQQRHKDMAADADKILDLARQIRGAASSSDATAAASVLPQLETVEKLARRIKSMMQENVNISQLKRPAAAPRVVGKGFRRPLSQSGL